MVLLCICMYWLLPYSFLPFPKIIFHCNLQSMTALFLISMVYKPAPCSLIQTADLSLHLKIPPHLTESCQLAKSSCCEGRLVFFFFLKSKQINTSDLSVHFRIFCAGWEGSDCWWLGVQWGQVVCLASTVTWVLSLRIEPPEALSLPSSP